MAALIPKSDELEPAPALIAEIEALPHPSTARHGVLAFSVAMAVLLYLDRFAIGVAVPAIRKDLDLTKTEIGFTLSAFFWSYALAQVPAGWLGDRWGGRRMLTLYVTAWSLAIAGVGLARGLASLFIMRAFLGLGQAGAYATTAGFLRRWIPLARRGFANGAVSLGGRGGALLAPLLTPWLMLAAGQFGYKTESWRIAFMIYALLGFAWAALFWRWFRDSPREHERCNAGELALIECGATSSTLASARGPSGIPLAALLTSRNTWLIGLDNFCINVGWAFLATWLPNYLIEEYSMTEVKAGTLTSFTALAGMAGCLIGGAATDRLVLRFALKWGRRLPSIIAYAGAAITWLACMGHHSLTVFVVLLAIAYLLGDVPLGSLWATYQDTGGVYAGTVLGWGNMCGNLGIGLAIALIGYMSDHGYSWNTVFLMSACSYAVAACCWFFIDPRVLIVEVDPSSPADKIDT